MRSLGLFTRTLVAILSTFFLPSTASFAEPQSTFIILDGSGSMWAKLANENLTKFDVVRPKLTDVLAAAPNADIGLAGFGYRRRRDCSDAGVLVPLGSPRATFDTALAEFDPRGKSPVVAALQAMQQNIGDNSPSNVIVFADSADNCRQNACAFASNFAQSFPGIPIHLIGIGLGAQHTERMQCLSELTGGKFWNATTTGEIEQAIDEAAEVAGLTGQAAIAQQPAPVEQPPPPTPGITQLRATLALAEDGNAINLPVKWQLQKDGSNEPGIVTERPSFSAKLEPGSYKLTATLNGMQVSQAAELTEGETTTLVLALHAARLRLRALDVKSGKVLPTTLLTVEQKNADAETSEVPRIAPRGRLDAFVLPAQYVVTAVDGPIRKVRTIEAAEGQDIQADIVLSAGRLELSVTDGFSSEPLDNVTTIVSVDDPDSPNGRREVARSRAAQSAFTLQAGTYYITARSGLSEVRQRIALSAGETMSRTLALPIATVNLSARIAGQPASKDDGLVYRIRALDKGARELARSLEPETTLRIPPGNYAVTAHLDAYGLSAEKTFEVAPNKATDVSIEIEAADVRFARAGQIGTNASDRFWQVLDSDGLAIWRTTVRKPRALLAPGKYTVRLEQRAELLEAAFEARNGEQKMITLGQNTSQNPD